jgi:hypothetical protein
MPSFMVVYHHGDGHYDGGSEAAASASLPFGNGQYRHGERTKAPIAEQRKFSALLKLLRT